MTPISQPEPKSRSQGAQPTEPPRHPKIILDILMVVDSKLFQTGSNLGNLRITTVT